MNMDPKARLTAALDAADRIEAETEKRQQEIGNAHKAATDNFTTHQTTVIEPTLEECAVQIRARGHEVVIEPGKSAHSVLMIIRPRSVAGSTQPSSRMPTLSFELATNPLGSIKVELRNLLRPAPLPPMVVGTSVVTPDKIRDWVAEIVESGVKGFVA